MAELERHHFYFAVSINFLDKAGTLFAIQKGFVENNIVVNALLNFYGVFFGLLISFVVGTWAFYKCVENSKDPKKTVLANRIYYGLTGLYVLSLIINTMTLRGY